MEEVIVHDRKFTPLIDSERIATRVRELATELNTRYAGEKPIFLAVLNGAFIFAADLLRQINFPHEISFVKFSSYRGTVSTGDVKQLIGISENLKGRRVIILEDIIETGRTMNELIHEIKQLEPSGVTVVTLLYKPIPEVTPPQMDHIGFTIEDHFVLGYGLDYDGYGRNLKEIYAESGK